MKKNISIVILVIALLTIVFSVFAYRMTRVDYVLDAIEKTDKVLQVEIQKERIPDSITNIITSPTIKSQRGFWIADDASNEIKTVDESLNTVSSFALPSNCGLGNILIPDNSRGNDNFARVTCSDGVTYFFSDKEIAYKADFLKNTDNAILSKDAKFLAFLDPIAQNPNELVIVNTADNSRKYFVLESVGSGKVVKKDEEFKKGLGQLNKFLIQPVSADCGFLGPQPVFFDTQSNNLFVESVCIDGLGGLYRIDLQNFAVADLNISNLARLFSDEDGKEMLYLYKDEESGQKVSLYEKENGKLIKDITLQIDLKYTSADWGYPVVGLSQDNKHLLLNSAVYECGGKSVECDRNYEKYVIVDFASGKTEFEIAKDMHVSLVEFVGSVDTRIFFNATVDEITRLKSINLETREIETVAAFKDSEIFLGIK